MIVARSLSRFRGPRPQSDYSKGLGTDILPSPRGPTFQADQLPNWRDDKDRAFPWYPNCSVPPCADKLATLWAKCWDEGSVFVRTSDVCKCQVSYATGGQSAGYSVRSTQPAGEECGPGRWGAACGGDGFFLVVLRNDFTVLTSVGPLFVRRRGCLARSRAVLVLRPGSSRGLELLGIREARPPTLRCGAAARRARRSPAAAPKAAAGGSRSSCVHSCSGAP